MSHETYTVSSVEGARKKSPRIGFAVRVRSAGQNYGPTCHQRGRADVTKFVTLVRLSSLEQHVGVLALAGYKRRKSALTANPIDRSGRGTSGHRLDTGECPTTIGYCATSLFQLNFRDYVHRGLSNDGPYWE